ncbi:MAG: putative Ig domain-containing protein, partial [Synergistaceae bacterium]|nr:putative Ig domain-containing protein [Synergistaceae bacterium]
NVSKNTALISLSCYNNMLTSLNVKGCCRLSSLNCGSNRLTTLNVSQCISLSSLFCYNNRLTKLDVSNCGRLSDGYINCDYNVQIVRTTKTKPTILTSSLPNATKGRDYRESLMAYGSLPISWTAKGLPAGLTCNKSGDITGAPTKTGTFTVTVTAKNSKGSVSKKLTLKVGIAPTITTTSLKNGTKGKSYSVTLKATGSKTITWSAQRLPAGLTINAATGKISGKPTEGEVIYYFAVTAKNAYGSHTAYFNLYIAAGTSSSSTAAYTMNANSSTEAKTPETSLDSPNGKSSHSGKGNSSPSLRAETQTEGYVIAPVFDEVISVDKAGLYDFDVEFDKDTPEGWTLVWLANSSEPSDDDEIADFFNSEGTPIEVVPGDKKITVSVWLNPNRKYEPAIAVKKVTE